MDVQSGSVFYLGLVLTCTGLDVPDFEKSSMYQNQIDFSIFKKQQRFWGRIGGRLFNWRNGNECVLHLHHLLGTRLTIRGSLCSGLCGWLHLHPLEHHRIADTNDSPLPGRCQGEYLANDEGNAWKSDVFFEVFDISFQRLQRFKLPRPNFWWLTGEPRYWCWCWPFSVLHRIPKLRRAPFLTDALEVF